MKRIIIAIVICCMTACASNLDRGVAHYERGEYDIAARYWNPIAKQGNQYAQYNLGLLWEYGLGNTPKNIEEAAKWYITSAKQGNPAAMVKVAEYQFSIGLNENALSWINLAARWGNTDAINKLESMGESVPRADLYENMIAENERKKREDQAAIAGLITLGAMVAVATSGNGQSSDSSSYYPSSSSSSNTSFYPNDNTSTTSRGGYTTTTEEKDNSCSSDYSCGIGYSCVKKPYSSTGVCLKSVDSYGIPTYKMPDSNSIGVNTESSCTFSTDCPIGFRCDSELKACVK